MLGIGKKYTMRWNATYEYSAQSNDLAARLNADNSTFSENINTNAVFSYLWKPRLWHHLQHEVYAGYREDTQNVKLLHNGKPASNEIPHFSHSVSTTQSAEMQLIEYSH